MTRDIATIRTWWLESEKLTLVVEFPSERAARLAVARYDDLAEALGEPEADAWAEDIIAGVGGRILEVHYSP